jgi:hypothetical protein
MLKALVAMLALIIGLTFGAVTFVQADEKASAPAPAAGGAAPAEKKDMSGDKKDMAGDKKAEKKADKKAKK